MCVCVHARARACLHACVRACVWYVSECVRIYVVVYSMLKVFQLKKNSVTSKALLQSH